MAGAATAVDRRRILWTGVLLGVGVVGTLDEVIFHQLLQWHFFYVHTNSFWRTFSDGIFHLFASGALLWGALRLWRDRGGARTREASLVFGAGLLFGGGGFNLFDGTVDHKILQIHPVRLGVENPLPYDLAWNGVSLALIALGWLLWRRSKRAQREHTVLPGER